MTAAIAAPLIDGAVPADGLTFTARSPKPGGVTIGTMCPTLAYRLAERGYALTIVSRPQRATAAPCKQCDGEHR